MINWTTGWTLNVIHRDWTVKSLNFCRQCIMHFLLITKLVLVSLISLYLLIRALKKIKVLSTEFTESKMLSENLQSVGKIGGWQLELASNKVIWTSQTYTIHDLPQETPLGLIQAYEFYKDGEKDRIAQAVQNCVKGIGYHDTFRFTSAKGVEKWVECTGLPVFDKNNQIYKLRGTIQDVTEAVNLRNESEKEQFQTNTLKQQMSLILNHSPAAVYECLSNQNWTMMYISSFIEKLSGYPATDFINDQIRSYTSIIHPDDIKYVETTVLNSVQAGSSFDLNYRIITKSGEVRAVWERGSFEPNTGNLIGIIFDLTEQKSYEKLLDEAQSVAKLGNWSFLLGTQEVKWSQQMYQLFPENKDKGPPTFERHKSTIHPEDQEKWLKTVLNCAQNGISYKMRFRVAHPNQILWIEAIGHAVKDHDGKVVSMSGTCQDVSESVLLEETSNLQKIKNMQTTKLASLGEMSAGVAHEINNPLAIISGNLQLISKDIFDQEKLLKKIDVMLKATERISKIVNGLKKFSRLSEQTERQPQNLINIVQETLYILEIKAHQNFVKLQVFNESKSLVLCNSVEIEQVIINLVNNSLDAIKNLQEKWVNIRIFDHQNQVILQVEDSGLGVNPSIENKLFDPFFTTKSVGEGTGLGLSITKGILDEHEAEISLNKSTSHTCFEIRFPQHLQSSRYVI